MEYEVVISNESLNDLIDKVNLKIEEGWKPQGGISVTSHVAPILSPDPYLIITQAMIKE